MAIKESKLIATLIDKVTAPARGVSKALDSITAASRRNDLAIAAVQQKMVGAAIGAYGFAKSFAAPIKAAMDFESAMADVKKVVDFDTPAEFKQFQADILEMSTRIPMAAKELSSIVAAAGQSGLDKSELQAFTEMAAKVGVAFDISAEQAGDALAKLKTGLGLTIPETSRLADAMNHLSNSQASAAKDILDVVRRVGAQSKQFGFTEIQVSAFASAMLSAGAESEVAATSFRNMGKALTRGGSAAKRQLLAYRKIGLESTTVAKRMQVDAVGTTLDVLERIGNLPKHLQAAVSSDLFGDEARALGPLLTNLPLLRKSLALVARETEYLGSAQKEYQARAATFSNDLQLLRNRLNRVGVIIGTALIPPLKSLMDVLEPVIDGFGKFAEANPGLVKGLSLAAAGLVSFRVAALGAQFVGLQMKGAVLQLAGGALMAAQGLGALTKALFITPVVTAATSALAGLRVALITTSLAGAGGTFKMMGASLLGLLNPINIVKAAWVGLRAIMLASGIGAIVAGIAAAGVWIYNNWSGIGVAFEAFKGAFDRAIAPIKPALEPVTNAISGLFDWVSNLLGPIDDTGASWARWGIAAGKAVGETLVAMVDFVKRATTWAADLGKAIVDGAGALYDAGTALMQSLWDGIAKKFDELVTWLKGLPGRIVSAIGSIDLSGIIKMPSFFGGGGKVEARAKGGDVNEGQPYVVGEKGPELFVPGLSGSIIPASLTKALRAATLAGSIAAAPAMPAAAAPAMPTLPARSAPTQTATTAPVNVTIGDIIINAPNVTDPEQVARIVMREISGSLARVHTGAHIDIA